MTFEGFRRAAFRRPAHTFRSHSDVHIANMTDEGRLLFSGMGATFICYRPRSHQIDMMALQPRRWACRILMQRTSSREIAPNIQSSW